MTEFADGTDGDPADSPSQIFIEELEFVVTEPEPAAEAEIPPPVLEALHRIVDVRFEQEVRAAKSEAAAARKEAQAAKNDEAARNDMKRAEARKKQENKDRFKPLLFIIATLAAWSLIIVLANVAVTCVPGGDACSAAGPFTPSTPMSKLQWVLTLVSGVAALWVSRMMVYPSREFPTQ